MTSRLYTIAELEDAKLQAEEDKKILRLLVSGKSMEEVSIKKNVSEEYIKSLLEDK